MYAQSIRVGIHRGLLIPIQMELCLGCLQLNFPFFDQDPGSATVDAPDREHGGRIDYSEITGRYDQGPVRIVEHPEDDFSLENVHVEDSPFRSISDPRIRVQGNSGSVGKTESFAHRRVSRDW